MYTQQVQASLRLSVCVKIIMKLSFYSDERVSDAILDENVDIHLVRNHFSQDAWMSVEDVIQRKSDNMVWICHTCLHDLHSEESILCDSCLLWFHFRCVGLTKSPKLKKWFCRACHAAAKQVH